MDSSQDSNNSSDIENDLRSHTTAESATQSGAKLETDFLRQESKNSGQAPPENPQGWLSKIAATQTVLMSNLHDPDPPPTVPNGRLHIIPLYGTENEIIQTERESQALLVVNKTVTRNGALLALHHQMAEIEISAVFRGTNREGILDEENLFKELMIDKNLSGYSAVVVRESFNLNIGMNILFKMLKTLFSKRSDFRLIMASSSTVDPKKLSEYFRDCTVLTLPRPAFPVQILYPREPITDYLEVASIWAADIHTSQIPSSGDIVLFLAREEDIDSVAKSIYKRLSERARSGKIEKYVVLSVYSGEKDPEIFGDRDPMARKVIVTTDVAKSSFEFDNVKFVIDCGFQRRHWNNRRKKLAINSLEVAPISQALALKRAARAGRAGPGGKCFRMYTKPAYLNEMGPTTPPDMQRMDLSNIVLRSFVLGVNFDFIDKPSPDSIVDAMRQLYCFGAIDPNGKLTSLGEQMAGFAVPPVLSRILVESASVDLRCSDEALTIVAMVWSGGMVFCRPEEDEKRVAAKLKWVGFLSPEGDHLTLLKVFESWKESAFSEQWCLDNFVEHNTLCRAKEIRNRLIATFDRQKKNIVSAEKNYTKIRKAITAGLFFHAARWDPREGFYRALIDNQPVHIHSSSALFLKKPSWVVFEDLLVVNEKEYMIRVTSIDPNWLRELAPRFFRKADPSRALMSQQESRGRGDPDSGPGEDDESAES